MIPLITQTPRLQLLAASRALLTAALQKPQYFPVLLGAELPTSWPPATPTPAQLAEQLELLTDGGRLAAGWYGWYALRRAEGDTPRTLVGTAAFLGPPDTAGKAEVEFAIVPEWRGQGLGTEVLAGLVQQAEATGLVRLLIAHATPGNAAALATLRRNGFNESPLHAGNMLRFERAIEPTEAA